MEGKKNERRFIIRDGVLKHVPAHMITEEKYRNILLFEGWKHCTDADLIQRHYEFPEGLPDFLKSTGKSAPESNKPTSSSNDKGKKISTPKSEKKENKEGV